MIKKIKNTISRTITALFLNEIFVPFKSFQFLLYMLIFDFKFLSLQFQLLNDLTWISRKCLWIILVFPFSSFLCYLFNPGERLILEILFNINTQRSLIIHWILQSLLLVLLLIDQKWFRYWICVLQLFSTPKLMTILLLNRSKSLNWRWRFVCRLDRIVPVIIEIIWKTILARS